MLPLFQETFSKMIMGNKPHLSYLFIFIFLQIVSSSLSLNTSCPIDFGYVQTFPWDTSLCHNPIDKSCCQTLISLFGMGLAQYLKDTSIFYLPNVETSVSCLSGLANKLLVKNVSNKLVPQCLGNASQFVVNSSDCAGITTTQDWIKKVGPKTELDSSCNGDLTGLAPCGLCLDAGLHVNSQLVSFDKSSTKNSSTKCFFYVVLYSSAIVNEFGPKDPRSANCILGLPLDTSQNKKPSPKKSRESLYAIIFGSLGGIIIVLLFIGVVLFYMLRAKRKKQKALHEEYVTSVRTRVLPNTGAKWFTLAELEEATSGFPQRNMIGQGGYGVVYKGILSDGTLVAVKQMLDLDSKGDEEFVNEVEIISKIRHRNLLSLRGCCVTSDDKKGKTRYLIYDFMPNGSLDDHLFINSGDRKLTWPQRKNMVLDVGKGLSYLHTGIKPSIYHRDIKPTNILLDLKMRAVVADFGLAKQSTEGNTHLTTRVAGTYGYLAPEYGLYGQLTDKSDVYSFGIVILEIMSGRKVLDTSDKSAVLISDWAWMLVKSGKLQEIFDRGIRDGPSGVMERYVLVGILCAHVMVALRPTIGDALKMLEGDIDIPKIPDRPLPLSHESFRSSFLNNSSSISGLTSRIFSL